jgi:hypothetical protein
MRLVHNLVAVATLVAAPAIAQTVAPQRSAPGHDSTSNPAVASPSDTGKAAAPAAGANSFTEGQAKSRLESDGYTNITQLLKDDHGVWRGQATKAGQTVNVAVDYKGDIVAR